MSESINMVSPPPNAISVDIGLGAAIMTLYVAVTLVLLGALVYDESTFKNPEYGIAILFAVFWPVLVGFAVFKQLVNHRRSQ